VILILKGRPRVMPGRYKSLYFTFPVNVYLREKWKKVNHTICVIQKRTECHLLVPGYLNKLIQMQNPILIMTG
jgi:hypothetical protein